MQVEHGAHVVFLGVHHLLVIGFAEEGQGHPVTAQGRLDDVGDEVLVFLLVVVCEVLAAGLLVTAQVEVGAVSDAPQLAPVGEGEGVLDVGGGPGVESQLGRLVIPEAKVFLLNT